MNSEHDVIVIGFGPGGEVATSLLGQRGHRVLAVDAAAQPYGLPRMSTLDGEIARVLQHAADPAEAMTDAIPALGVRLFGADGATLPTLDWSARIGGHWTHYSLHQPNIEAAMKRRIDQCDNVTVSWGTRAVGLRQFGDRVSVDLESATGTETVTARYVLGFDGASSFVRESVGITLEVLHEHDDVWILTDFDGLRELPDEAMFNQIHMTPAGPWFAGPNGANKCRTDVRVNADEDVTELLAEDRGYEFLEQHLGLTREDVRMTRRVAYRFRSQWATRFRSGNVFIGGDAAHAMCPSMGQGACCAMRDAANLAWKLDLVLSAKADEELLDTYESERLPHSVFFVTASLELYKAVIIPDSGIAALRDDGFRAAGGEQQPFPGLANGIIRSTPAGEPAPFAGTLAPQPRVLADSGEALLDDIVGYGFQLVSRVPLAESLGSSRLERLRALGVHVLVVDQAEEADLVPADEEYEGFWAASGAVAFLARPDHYLFGLAESVDDAVALVDDLLQAIPVPTHQLVGPQRAGR